MTTMETPDVPYFRDLVTSSEELFKTKCSDWEQIHDTNSSIISEDVSGQIRSVIGQAQLLVNQRLKQFSVLIDNCEFHRGEKETTCSDLQGFWDMIYFQIEDVNRKFEALDVIQKNNWTSPESASLPAKNVKKVNHTAKVRNPMHAKSSMKSHILAARKRLEDVKRQENKENKVFDMPGFFTVSSPVKTPVPRRSHSACTPVKEKSLRKFILSPQEADPMKFNMDFNKVAKETVQNVKGFQKQML